MKRVSQHVERYLAALREHCGVNLAQEPQGKENFMNITAHLLKPYSELRPALKPPYGFLLIHTGRA